MGSKDVSASSEASDSLLPKMEGWLHDKEKKTGKQQIRNTT